MLLKPKTESKGLLGKFFGAFNRVFGRATDGYVNTSGWLVRKSGVAILILVLVSAGVVLLGSKLPGGFLPTEDQGYAFVALQLPQGASLKRTTEAAAAVENALKNVPGVEYVTSVAGFSLLSTTQDTYNGFFFITLKDWDDRKSKQEQFAAITQNLQKQLGTVRQGLAYAIPAPAIPGLGNSGGVSMVLEDRTGAKDPAFLTQNTFKFLGALHGHPEISQAVPTFYPDVPQLYVDVDKEKVSQQQVALSDVYTTMQTFMGGYLVNHFNRFGRQWQTYIEAEGQSRKSIDNIGQFYVTAANGSPVQLSALTSVRRTTGPEFTTRFNEYEASQITIIGTSGFTTAQVMKVVEQVFAQSMPKGMGMDYSGMSFQEQQAQKSIPTWVIYAISITFCFLILAAQYESWSLPFGVLLSTPVAIFGAYLALTLRHLENDVYAQIGLVMLIGLSAKNAILIVEFAKDEYEKGETIFEAAMNAARIRFRPILMTAFAFILGCMPLWFASGSGAASRRILGTVVIGGMAMATVVAILLIPVTYSLAERVSNKIGKAHDGSLEVKGSKDPNQYNGPSQTLEDLEKKKTQGKNKPEEHNLPVLEGGQA